MPSTPISPCPSCPPHPVGRTWLRGVLVVGDRCTVGDPRTAAAGAGQHGRPRRTTREALPPSDSGRHPGHRGRWYRGAPTAGAVPASRDGVRGLRPLGPRRSVAAHPRRGPRPTAGAGRAGPVPERGDHRLADATRRRHRAPIRPRLRWRHQNHRRHAAPHGGGERPAAHRRRHRRLDPRPRRRTPTPGRTARQLLHHRAGRGRRRLPRDGCSSGRQTFSPSLCRSSNASPAPLGFHVRPRLWVVERRFAGITQHRRCVRDYETRPDHHEAMVHLAMITTMTRRLART
jgi:hypothetical protein